MSVLQLWTAVINDISWVNGVEYVVMGIAIEHDALLPG